MVKLNCKVSAINLSNLTPGDAACEDKVMYYIHCKFIEPPNVGNIIAFATNNRPQAGKFNSAGPPVYSFKGAPVLLD